jgi:hypothetical protein
VTADLIAAKYTNTPTDGLLVAAIRAVLPKRRIEVVQGVLWLYGASRGILLPKHATLAQWDHMRGVAVEPFSFDLDLPEAPK